MKSNLDEVEKRAILTKTLVFDGAHGFQTVLHFGHTGTVYIADGVHRFHPDGVDFAVRIQAADLYNPETYQTFKGYDRTLPAPNDPEKCKLHW